MKHPAKLPESVFETLKRSRLGTMMAVRQESCRSEAEALPAPRKDFRKLPLAADLGKRQAGKAGMPHGAQLALQAVGEVLELGDGRLWLARKHPSHVAVGILLGELLGHLAQVGHNLVQCVTVICDGAGCMSGDL